MFDKYFKWFYVVPALCVALVLGTGWHLEHLQKENQDVLSAIKQEQDKLQSLVQANDKTVYVVQGDKNVETLAQPTERTLLTVGHLMLNFNSPQQYTNNRQTLKYKYIKDDNFFNGKNAIMGSTTDIDGNNALAISGTKSFVKEVIPGRVPGTDRYYLLIKSYFYKNSRDLQYLSDLKPTFRLLTFNYNNGTLTNIQKDQRVGLTAGGSDE